VLPDRHVGHVQVCKLELRAARRQGGGLGQGERAGGGLAAAQARLGGGAAGPAGRGIGSGRLRLRRALRLRRRTSSLVGAARLSRRAITLPEPPCGL
jgi:hypothetical protein